MKSNLTLSTVQLYQLDLHNRPISCASSCLIYFDQKRFLLTVEHATGNKGRWAFELGYERPHGTKMFPVGEMNFLKRFSLSDNSSTTVDFSYVQIPLDLEVCRHFLSAQGETTSKNILHTYSSDDIVPPTIEETFGFSGAVLPEFEANSSQPSHPWLKQEFRFYEGLTFIREQDDFYVFQLPLVHPGHEHFRGCSGAPVINSKNKIVGLVSRGDVASGTIFAISLPRMSSVLIAAMQSNSSK